MAFFSPHFLLTILFCSAAIAATAHAQDAALFLVVPGEIQAPIGGDPGAVVIMGRGLEAATGVRFESSFDTFAAESFAVESDVSIRIELPTDLERDGLYDVVVALPDGELRLEEAFTFFFGGSEGEGEGEGEVPAGCAAPGTCRFPFQPPGGKGEGEGEGEPDVVRSGVGGDSSLVQASIICAVWDATSEERQGISGATLSARDGAIRGSEYQPGIYAFPQLEAGRYTVLVEDEALGDCEEELEITGGETLYISFPMGDCADKQAPVRLPFAETPLFMVTVGLLFLRSWPRLQARCR